jgi:hypothetical protein
MLLKFGGETRSNNISALLHVLHVCFSDNYYRRLLVGMPGKR